MEYDGETESDQGKAPTSILRLVVKSSAVLPSKRRVAILDTKTEVQIGRDRPISQDTPRIRLKELEVSKFHATLYWNSEHERWAAGNSDGDDIVGYGKDGGALFLQQL